MADKYEEIRRRMILYRKSQNLAQEEVAATLGVSQSRICKGETGHESITNDYLTALYKIGWDIDYIVTGKKWKKKRKTLRSELLDFSDDDEIFKVIYWTMSNMYKNQYLHEVYSLELKLLNFMCHNKDINVFEAVRRIYDMTQLEYADLLHITVKRCRSLERGVSHLSADLMGEMYEMLGCRPTLLMEVEDIRWNIIESIWSFIPVKEEKLFIDLINSIIRYYKYVTERKA